MKIKAKLAPNHSFMLFNNHSSNQFSLGFIDHSFTLFLHCLPISFRLLISHSKPKFIATYSLLHCNLMLLYHSCLMKPFACSYIGIAMVIFMYSYPMWNGNIFILKYWWDITLSSGFKVLYLFLCCEWTIMSLLCYSLDYVNLIAATI